jgi:MATE family multidrug resistance protein
MWRRGHFNKTWPGWQLREAMKAARLRRFFGQAAGNALSQALNTWGVDATSLMAGAHLGYLPLAAQSAAYYILFTLNALQYGASTAVTVRVGQHLGAALLRRAKSAVRIGLAVVLVVSAVLSIALVGVRDYVGRIFSQDMHVVQAISDVTPWVALAFLAYGVSMLLTGVLNAQARPGIASAGTLVCKWAIDLPLAFFFVLHAHTCGEVVVSLAFTMLKTHLCLAPQRAQGNLVGHVDRQLHVRERG